MNYNEMVKESKKIMEEQNLTDSNKIIKNENPKKQEENVELNNL